MAGQIPTALTPAAIVYSWQQLLSRAGVEITDRSEIGYNRLGLTLQYGSYVCGEQRSPDRTVRVMPSSEDGWSRLLNAPSNHIDWLPISGTVPQGAELPWSDSIPVLFWGEGSADGSILFAKRLPDGSVLFLVDIISAMFFMLSRWEEAVVLTRDEHERFPATASVAYKQSFLDRPVVDEYALILREWLRMLLPSWEPNSRPFSVKLSHDIDFVSRFPNWHAAFRRFGGDLLRRRSPGAAWRTVVDATARALAPTRTSYYQGIHCLAKLSRAYGLGTDAFYFMAAQPGPLENDYDLASPPIMQCIEDLRDQGFEIGLHAGYHTLDDPEQLTMQKVRLDAVIGKGRYGGRQHFLRFKVPDTWRHWERLGLEYDSTMAFAGHEGFRCGTCHPFRPFDLNADRELNLWEWPLIVMDRTLRDQRKLSPELSEIRILELARRCKRVEGTFTLLWHNSSLDWEWEPWRKMYERVVKALSEMQSGGYDQ